MTPRIENIASKEINQFIQILINHTSFTQKIDTHKLYKKENNSISFQMNYINDIASNYIHNLEETLLKLEEGSYQENNHSPYNKKLLKINQQKGIVARIPIGSLTNNIFLQDRGPSFSIKYKTLSLTSSNIDKKIKNYILDCFSPHPGEEVTVSIPMCDDTVDIVLEDLDFPHEWEELLENSGADTMGDLVDYLCHCSQNNISLAISPEDEEKLYATLIDVCYDNMSYDRQVDFWRHVMETNSLVCEVKE